MKFNQTGFPLPAWLIAVMFVVGIGVGLGIAVMLSVMGQQSTTDGVKPWDDERAKILIDNSDKNPVDKNILKQENKIEAKNDTKQIDSEELMLPSQKDYRWLKNITKGPVKRAIKNAIGKITPDIIGCASFSKPKEILSELEFEAIGGMATLSRIDSYLKPAIQTQFDLCVIKKIGELLIDFPVEDGSYKVLYTFKKTSTKQKP